MNPLKQVSDEDLALYALQLLPADDAAAVTLHLEHNNERRQELIAIQGDLAMYAYTTEMHSPPAAVRQQLLEAIARERKSAPVDQRIANLSASSDALAPTSFARVTSIDDAPARRSAATKILPWLGWAVAAGVTFASFNLYQQREALKGTIANQSFQMAKVNADAARAHEVLSTLLDSSAAHITLTKALAAPVPQGRATYVAEKGSLIFIASNMAPLQTYKTYELWLIPVEGAPIPAGTFHPDERGNASVILPNLPKGVIAKEFGITIEDEGGSTAPTLPIIMVGE